MAVSQPTLQPSSTSRNEPINSSIRQMNVNQSRRRPQREIKRVGKLGKLIFLNNLVFTVLWTCCILRLIILIPLVGRRFIPIAIAEFFQILITCSYISQFVVSNLSIVKQSRRAKPNTANICLRFLKLLNGLFITWIIIFHYPKVSRHSSYSLFVFAVSIIEAANYFSYLMPNTMTHYFKKSSFFIFFPLQKLSELILLLLSFKFNKRLQTRFIELNSGGTEELVNWEYIIGLFLNFAAFAYLPMSCLVYYINYKRS